MSPTPTDTLLRAATQPNLPGVFARLGRDTEVLSNGQGGRPAHPILHADPEYMSSMLEVLDEEGGVVELLRAAGLDDSWQARLTERLVER